VDTAAARDRASVVSAARKMQSMAPRVPPHVSKMYDNERLKWNENNDAYKLSISFVRIRRTSMTSVSAEAIFDSGQQL
jgi:hypothetical protein